MMDTVIASSLLFCAVMAIFIYLGRNPKPPKKPKGIIMPKIGKKR